MSVVYGKLIAVSLPTLAAILSFLWLKNRRKGRHLPADQSRIVVGSNKIEHTQNESILAICDTSEEICFKGDKDTCMSIEDASVGQFTVAEISITRGETEQSPTTKVVEPIPVIEEIIIKSEIDLSKSAVVELEKSDIIQGEEILPEIEDSPAEDCLTSVLAPEKVSSEATGSLKEIEMKKESEPLVESMKEMDINNMNKEPGQLSDKLVSLELDQMKMDERKSSSERDSANHSPSEVMLASPSISNFSDAHSEGSSDSGKGQSDVNITPSRTPAGGSSLAGEQPISIYEFVLAQHMVGRLIGRHGSFLNEIKSETHTNIFIKRHPESVKLKVCAIEGSQQDIDKALAKIRQKFPIRRFPNLTLEKVSFVQLPVLDIKYQDNHMKLIEGVNNDVVLSSLITAGHYFLQLNHHPTYSLLTPFNTVMNTIYSSGEPPAFDTPVNSAICAAPAVEGWYRAQVTDIEEDGVHCSVKYLDYGGYSRIPFSGIRQIRADLLTLPFQAIECYLACVSPYPGEEWSQEAKSFVHYLTIGQELRAQVMGYAPDGVPYIYLYCSAEGQVVLLNEALVLNGFAVVKYEDYYASTTASEDEGMKRTDEEATKSDRETE